jgi:hypothetical protein
MGAPGFCCEIPGATTEDRRTSFPRQALRLGALIPHGGLPYE